MDDEAEIYNQFQYWRDPLPDIDSDLNCNEINKATCTTVTISNTISAEDSLWISSNNSNNNNISCSNSSQIFNQRLPQSPQQLPQHQQSPYPPPQQAPQPQKAMASLVVSMNGFSTIYSQMENININFIIFSLISVRFF